MNLLYRLDIELAKFKSLPISPTHLPIVLVIIAQFLNSVRAHGTMIDPVSRNSLWRIDGSAPINYNDIELFCGGIGVSLMMADDHLLIIISQYLINKKHFIM